MNSDLETAVKRETRRINFEVAEDYLNTSTQSLVSNHNKIVCELIANGADAKAKNIFVVLEEDLVGVSDDGLGMNDEGIDAFCRAGDSLKKQNRQRDDGVYYMGNFGVASALIPVLGRKYSMHTVFDGVGNSIEEFIPDGTILANRPIDIVPFDGTGEESYTDIQITDLKLQKGFNERDLRRAIQREFTPFRKFNIYVNDKLVEPRKMENATKVAYSETISNVGDVTGNFYLSKKSLGDDAGIFVYVNGRMVADPENIVDYKPIKNGMKNIVVGEIFVNGGELDESTLINREAFAETEAYRNLQAAMQIAVKELVPLYKEKTVIDKKYKIQTGAKTFLSGKLNAFIRKDVPYINDTIFLSFDSMGADEYPVTFNSEAQELNVNKDHPRLRVLKTTSQAVYNNALLDEVINAIAVSSVNDSSTLLSALDSINDIRAELYDILNAGTDITTQESSNEIHPKIVYPVKEVRDRFDFSQKELNYLTSTGIMSFYEAGEVQGKEIVRVQELMNNKVTLLDLATEIFGSEPSQNDITRITKPLTGARDLLGSFVDVYEGEGKLGYLIDEMVVPYVVELLESDRAKPGKLYEPRGMFEMVNHTFWDPKTFTEKFRDVDMDFVTHVVEYAKEQDMKLGRQGERLHVPQFFEAAVEYRESLL